MYIKSLHIQNVIELIHWNRSNCLRSVSEKIISYLNNIILNKEKKRFKINKIETLRTLDQ